MTPLRPCPICYASTAEHLHAMRFALPPESPLPDAYAIVACAACGFVYADTPGSASDYARHYTDFSLYERPDATGGGTTPEDQERFKVMADLFRARCRPDARILDIGCGNGGLLFTLREAGFTRLVGMDPSSGCVARLQAGGVDGVSATLDQLPADIGHFDLIILSHVLEHLLEPRSALRAIRALLNEDGLLYVETPDAQHYSAQDFVPYYFFDSEHINHFEQHAFGNLARLSGCTPVEIGSKTIPVKGGQRYPAVQALLRKQSPRDSSPQYSAHSRQHMLAYIQASGHRAKEFAQLAANIAADRPLALWGAGSFAQRFLDQPWLTDRRIVAVVDNDPKKDGQHIAGCTIRKPAEGLQGLPADTLVLILIALHPQEAVQQYQQLGLPYAHLVVVA
jgi:SAM-dependent methyltransferase